MNLHIQASVADGVSSSRGVTLHKVEVDVFLQLLNGSQAQIPVLHINAVNAAATVVL